MTRILQWFLLLMTMGTVTSALHATFYPGTNISGITMSFVGVIIAFVPVTAAFFTSYHYSTKGLPTARDGALVAAGVWWVESFIFMAVANSGVTLPDTINFAAGVISVYTLFKFNDLMTATRETV